MNSMQRGTVTTNTPLCTSLMGVSSIDGNEVCVPARIETNPVTRKRRMPEQPSSQAPKASRQGFLNLGKDQTNRVTDLPEAGEDLAFHDDDDVKLTKKPPIHPDVSGKRQMEVQTLNRRNDSARLRKTIQWLEEGARKLREDLAEARSELYEERRASKLMKRELEVAVREARYTESDKHQKIINELKLRLAQSPSRASDQTQLNNVKVEMLKDENHRREMTVARKRLVEADETIRTLRSSSLDPGGTDTNKRRRLNAPYVQRMENEIRRLREATERLEERLQVVIDAERARTIELRVQHENYEAEICALKKAQRSDTIRMMEEIRSKEKDIEKLEKLAKRKLRARENELMRKLRESERGHQIRLGPSIEDKITRQQTTDSCKDEYDVGEVERLREVAIEQQEIIEFLRQALKERERKLDQLSNKKRKEEFYKQWLELEPVAEVDDEEEHEEGDSALSSGPSSLSPQPGGQWQSNGVSRETYEGLLLEFEELHTKYMEAQEELSHAKSQVRDLEQALLQETRGSQTSRRALSDKLRETEERESCLQAEISELREQNELLEFRVLELEETGGPRESPDTADSGIVSPEPIQRFKDQSNKQHRAIATVIPYNSYTQSLSPVPVQKPPLSLQESGIFEEDDDDQVEFATCGTQTETPSGDLLQEVQRLQELREKIQERAVKVPLENLETEDRLTSYKEQIQDLEERLAIYEAAEITRMNDQLLAKQREEDVLDENYRLTERVYWLENELRNLHEVGMNLIDVGTITDTINIQYHGKSTDDTITDISASSPCGKIFYDALKEIDDSAIRSESRMRLNELSGSSELLKSGYGDTECMACNIMRKNYNDTIQQLSQTECSFQRKEVAFAKTLQKVDASWMELELIHASNLRKNEQELKNKILLNQKILDRISGLEEMIRNHVCEGNSMNFDEVDMKEREEAPEGGIQTDELMEIDENSVNIGVNQSTQTEETDCEKDIHTGDVIRNTSGQIIAELAHEAREEDEEAVESSRTVSRIRILPDSTANDLVEITESDTDKKVRKSQSGRSERDGWVIRVRNTSKGSRSVKNVRAVVNGHRFVLYQEICV